MMRVFVGISLPDDVIDALDDLQSDLRVGTPMFASTFHVTLAFLDSQPPQTVQFLHESLGEIALPAFSMLIRGVDVFGGNAPRLVWAGVEPSKQLSTLRDKVRRAATDVGIDLPRQKFRPHVTLSRIRGRLRGDEPAKLAQFLSQNAAFSAPEFDVTRFSLLQSTLHPEGAVYVSLADYSLQ